MAVAYSLQCSVHCIISGWFHVNLTVTNSFPSEMCMRHHMLQCPPPGLHWPGTVTDSSFLTEGVLGCDYKNVYQTPSIPGSFEGFT